MSDHSHAEPAAQGRAPGASPSQRAGFLNYLVGLGFAIVLTLASFWAASTDTVWQPAVPVLLAALAIVCFVGLLVAALSHGWIIDREMAISPEQLAALDRERST